MRWRFLSLSLTGAVVAAPTIVGAQHSMDVQRRSADTEHLAALVAYERTPRRTLSSEARIAAGRSAWALSLSDRALEEFERVASDSALDPVEQARLHLSAGIIHFQEGRYQVASVKAERAVALLSTAGPLRSKANFLWAESLYRLGSLGPAAEKYGVALSEAAPEDQPDIHFALGTCARGLGTYEVAREHFEKVPLRHERTPEAIRNLAEIALDMKNFTNAGFWLARGRSDYPDQFLDSWTDYALVRVAIQSGKLNEVRELRAQAQGKYPPSDGWLTLLNAEAEAYEWQVLRR